MRQCRQSLDVGFSLSNLQRLVRIDLGPNGGFQSRDLLGPAHCKRRSNPLVKSLWKSPARTLFIVFPPGVEHATQIRVSVISFS
jgi:hypothetical protein